MNITKIIGCRFFKSEGEDSKPTELLKVIGIQNESILKVKDLLNNYIFKIDREKIEKEYILLEPDAYIGFSIVALQDSIEDVIVSLFRTKDMEESNNIPYCVCRQNIINLYTAMIRTQDLSSYESKEVGMCMSVNSIPDGTDYNIMTTCNKVNHITMVAAYMDDSLDTILSCIKEKKYDRVLEVLFQDHMKHVILDREEVSKDQIHMGYCRTLKTLLTYTNFMYDFRRAFGIAEIDFDLSNCINDNNTLSIDAKEAIQKLYNKYIIDELVIKFDKDIDLESIQVPKLLLCDKNDNVYLITYTEGKEYIEQEIRLNGRMNPTEKLEAIFKTTANIKVPDSLR